MLNFKPLDLLIIDDFFPNLITRFRVAEFNFYLSKFKSLIFSSYPNFESAYYDYAKLYPKFKKSIFPLSLIDIIRNRSPKLAYFVFLNNAYNFLNFINTFRVQFVFTLYPGGGFDLNDEISDQKLRLVLASKYFQKVIVTQKITYQYLLENSFCDERNIEFIYGAVIPSKKNCSIFPLEKKWFKTDKKTFDICFVAHKYMLQGMNKGYPIFIEVAKILSKINSSFSFHVVGDFNSSDIDLSEIESRVTFYGVQSESSFFRKFYKFQDIILSPNLPFILYPGNFDGFPTASCVEAALHGVPVFCTDPLSQNIHFKDDIDISIISTDPQEITSKVLFYFHHPQKLHKLAKYGQYKCQEIFGNSYQLEPRYNLLNRFLA